MENKNSCQTFSINGSTSKKDTSKIEKAEAILKKEKNNKMH